MADRDEFLRMVRDSLGVISGREIEPDDATAFFQDESRVGNQAAAVREHAGANRAELLDKMAEAAGAIGWLRGRKAHCCKHLRRLLRSVPSTSPGGATARSHGREPVEIGVENPPAPEGWRIGELVGWDTRTP